MMNQPKKLSIPTGVWPALVTPFDETGHIDWPALDACLEKQVQAGGISPRTVLLAEDDEVIPYRQAFEFFSGICGVKLL